MVVLLQLLDLLLKVIGEDRRLGCVENAQEQVVLSRHLVEQRFDALFRRLGVVERDALELRLVVGVGYGIRAVVKDAGDDVVIVVDVVEREVFQRVEIKRVVVVFEHAARCGEVVH